MRTIDMRSIDDKVLHDGSSLRVGGRVGGCGAVPTQRLLELVTGLHRGRPSIALVDVLVEVRLDSTAEVLSIHDRQTSTYGIPVCAALRPDIRLVLDRSSPDPRVLLDAAAWTASVEPVHIERLTALTFAEFVMGA